ncbi:MAG: DUF6644 family protein [Acidobacteriota bacterium]
MILSLAQWAQATPFFTALRESWYVYPIILSLHLIAIALFGGLILTTDLRLLGLVMKKRPVADVVGQLRGLKHAGFMLVAICGILMLGTKAEEYYYNAFFHAKLALFALVAIHALVFRGSVYSRAAEFDAAGRIPGIAKLAAALSLLLWIGIVIAGRGIGYIEPPLDKIHALRAPQTSDIAVVVRR